MGTWSRSHRWPARPEFPGGATYCATKHAVVGLSEAIRAELRDSNIDISVVMPVVVNTELGSGLPQTRGFKPVQPEDVADCIVEALQTGRFDVYVPKSIGGVVRFNALMPRRAAEWISRALKGDQVLANPDHAARAAYEARMAETISQSEPPASSTPSTLSIDETAAAVEAAATSAERERV